MMEIVKKFKLISQYDMSKTLNENLEKTDMFEQGVGTLKNIAQKSKKLSLKNLSKEELKLLRASIKNEIQTLLKLSPNEMKIATSMSDDNIKKLISTSFDNDFKKFGSVLKENGKFTDEVKSAIKIKTARDLMRNKGVMSEDFIYNTIEQNKKYYKNEAKKYSKNLTTTQQVKKDEEFIKKTIDDLNVPKKTSRLKKLGRVMAFIWLAPKFVAGLMVMGLAGFTIYGVSKLFGRTVTKEEFDEISKIKQSLDKFPQCIKDLVGPDNCRVGQDENGITLIVLKTGNPEYDKNGGISFSLNGRVTEVNTGRKGSWKCQGNKLKLNEQIGFGDVYDFMSGGTTKKAYDTFTKMFKGKELEPDEISNSVDDLDDQLSGDWLDSDSKDMKDAYNTIQNLIGYTYKGENAIQTVAREYKTKVGRDLSFDVVNKLKNLNLSGKEYQKQLLTTLKSNGVEVTHSPSSEVQNVVIKWDDQQGEQGGQSYIQPKPQQTYKPTQKKKSKYYPCNDFPFGFGCYSPKIRDLQICIGMEPKYQTGNFGPITTDRLQKKGYSLKQGITKELYNQIIQDNCGVKDKNMSIEPVKSKQPTISNTQVTPETMKQNLGLSKGKDTVDMIKK